MAPPRRDWSLRSGERQTEEKYSNVKANHRVRYEWAAETLGVIPDAIGYDLFCGTGYGSRVIADRCGCRVVGIDASAESIAFAERFYGTDRIEFVACEFPFPLRRESADFIVSFESLEHVKEDEVLASELIGGLKDCGRLILSVPNERKLPHATFRNRFHVRHYTRERVLELFAPLSLDRWFGQNVKDYTKGQRLDEDQMGLLPETEGQSLVFAFTKRVQ